MMDTVRLHHFTLSFPQRASDFLNSGSRHLDSPVLELQPTHPKFAFIVCELRQPCNHGMRSDPEIVVSGSLGPSPLAQLFGRLSLGPSRLCSFSSYLPPLFTGQLALSRVTTEPPQINRMRIFFSLLCHWLG